MTLLVYHLETALLVYLIANQDARYINWIGIKITTVHDIQSLQDKIVIGILKQIGERRNKLEQEILETTSSLQFWFSSSSVHTYFKAKLVEFLQKQPRIFQ